MSKLSIIIALIPELTAAECRELINRLKSFSSIAPSEKVPTKIGQSSPEDEILQIICYQLASMGVDFTPFYLLKKSTGMNSFRDKIPSILKFLEKSSLKRIERRAIIAAGVVALYESMAEQGWTVTARTVVNNIHRLPAALERQYPGYAKLGLLGKLIR